jgi:hypothetical protein
VPTLDYANSAFDDAQTFTASETVETFAADIVSSGVAVFRCVPEN